MLDPKSKKTKKPWPTKAAMEQVYAKKLWGDDALDFYSGIGSHLPELVNPYIEAVVAFLTSFKNPLSVCDLGCGDFNVGKELVNYTKKYVAVDIVAELIERNKKRFTEDHVSFHCLDIAVDELPTADCALLRQVLQHLSNMEIQQIAAKLPQFKYVVVTEHLPQGAFIPNKDIISGQSIRLKKKSGLNLLAPPFNVKVKEEKQLLVVKLDEGKGMIATTLYTLF